MKKRAPETRHCDACGIQFERPTGNAQLSNRRWAARRFCSNACAYSALSESRKNQGQFGHGAGRITLSPEQSSRALLLRLVNYGRNHDGLPGLSADRFRALEAELGVAA